MRLMRRVGADLVVSEWLRAEIRSSRFGSDVQAMLDRDGRERAVLEHPDLEDAEANAYRMEVIRERGFDYPDGVDGTLLGGFPVSQVVWWLAELDRHELRRVHYIDWDFWVKVSDGTRLPTDHVRLLDADPNRERGPADWLADRITRGDDVPLMICVDTGPATRLVVVEGHLRLTAYVMAGDAAPAHLRVLLGRSPAIAQWEHY